MTLAWDYSALAATYDKRPGYSEEVLNRIDQTARLEGGDPVADIGAGTGKLTRVLLERGYRVSAIEPNADMRRLGVRNAAGTVTWIDATAENTQLPDASMRAVFFGSSFNVVDRAKALNESARILRSGGWFVCLWNHRELDDPVQSRVEAIIHRMVPNFDYGSRREDQRRFIAESGRFGNAGLIEARFTHTFAVCDYLDAWRSHATLARQAGSRLETVIDAIAELLSGFGVLDVPYVTRAWCAPLLPDCRDE